MSAIDEIEHIVVLTLENRSFDHMLGSLPGVDGVVDAQGQVKAELFNHLDPTDPRSACFRPELGAQFSTPPDQEAAGGRYGGPAHSFPAATQQLFGAKTIGLGEQQTTPYRGEIPVTSPATNAGFVASFATELEGVYRSRHTSLEEQRSRAAAAGAPDPLQEVMQVFTAEQLPAIHALAQEFCVCDRWHSEVPGPTEPNRLFMHAATSAGLTCNPWQYDVLDTPTIYERIEAAGRDWAMYGFDLLDSSNFDSLAARPNAKRTWQQFLVDAAGGELPFYSFMCPRYADAPEGRANSQHAPHDVRFGDQLIADVYRALRSSPLWPHLLLVVIYDEHGGFYDHVSPPPAPRPDACVSPNEFMLREAKQHGRGYLAAPDYDFRFDRFGFRVPAILASAWIERGVVDSTLYSHASILAFVEEKLKQHPLTGRDGGAASFAAVLGRSAPRQDCLAELPAPELPETDPELYMQERPGAKQEDLTRRYTAKLAGHPDTGRRTDRSFPTNQALHDYIQERRRFDEWAHLDDWKTARFELFSDADGRWGWRLRDGSQQVLASSPESYANRAAAEVALQRVRFLAHQLGAVGSPEPVAPEPTQP